MYPKGNSKWLALLVSRAKSGSSWSEISTETYGMVSVQMVVKMARQVMEGGLGESEEKKAFYRLN